MRQSTCAAAVGNLSSGCSCRRVAVVDRVHQRVLVHRPCKLPVLGLHMVAWWHGGSPQHILMSTARAPERGGAQNRGGARNTGGWECSPRLPPAAPPPARSRAAGPERPGSWAGCHPAARRRGGSRAGRLPPRSAAAPEHNGAVKTCGRVCKASETIIWAQSARWGISNWFLH